MEPSRDAVKERSAGPGAAAKPRGLARLFEGWQLGAIVAGSVLSAALLTVPRAAQPDLFPVPLIDPGEEQAARARYDQLADRAVQQRLAFETRAVGDAVRRLGSALAAKRDAEHERRVLSERVSAALAARQQDSLLALRALQARLFVRAVREQDFARPAAAELAALGGDFAARAARNGWVDGDGFVGSDDELRTLFTLRWTELTSLREDARFRPSLGELRRYYRFLLLRPELGGGEDPARARALTRLRYVAALERRDKEYPAELARGSLLGGLGFAGQSVEALSQHLGRSSGAVWTLRARNYLLASAAEQPAEL